MPVEYKIFEDPILVCIRYSGHIVLQDVTAALEQFAQEPTRYLGQPHFFDLSDVTGFSFDYPKFFQILGNLADLYPAKAGEHLFVFLAPPGPPAELAHQLSPPLGEENPFIARIAQTLDQALDILGHRHPDLMAHLQTSPSA